MIIIEYQINGSIASSHLYLLLLVEAERDIFKEAEARVTAGQQPRCRCGGGGDLGCDADNGDDVIIAIVPIRCGVGGAVTTSPRVKIYIK